MDENTNAEPEQKSRPSVSSTELLAALRANAENRHALLNQLANDPINQTGQELLIARRSALFDLIEIIEATERGRDEEKKDGSQPSSPSACSAKSYAN